MDDVVKAILTGIGISIGIILALPPTVWVCGKWIAYWSAP